MDLPNHLRLQVGLPREGSLGLLCEFVLKQLEPVCECPSLSFGRMRWRVNSRMRNGIPLPFGNTQPPSGELLCCRHSSRGTLA
jgi:hypothetical protein